MSLELTSFSVFFNKFYVLLKRILPRCVMNLLDGFYMRIMIHRAQIRQTRALRKIRERRKIKVAFFLINASIWKYDTIYKLMRESHVFEPVVVVCPNTMYGKTAMLRDLKQAYEIFNSKGYDVIKTYDEKNDSWINVKKTINPDIVCFTNSYDLTKPEYCIHEWLDTLTCYVPYFFVTNNLDNSNYNCLLHNVAWRLFYETSIHKDIAKKVATNKAKNVVVSGYPALDIFFDKCYKPAYPWKISSPCIKRLIWAPHHTIEGQGGGLDYSNFLLYHETMFSLVEHFEGAIQIAFKPHPLLRDKLYKHAEWGKTRTDEYYSRWEQIGNGQLNESEYTDLFLTSDALIHDCASFMAEYLCLSKPTLYLIRDLSVRDRMNAFGKLALEVHYHAHGIKEIFSFIENVVIKKVDPMEKQRNEFVQKYLIPPNGKSASENVFNEIMAAVKPQKQTL